MADDDAQGGFFSELFAPVAGFGVTFATMFRKVATQEYPEVKWPTQPRFHGRTRRRLARGFALPFHRHRDRHAQTCRQQRRRGIGQRLEGAGGLGTGGEREPHAVRPVDRVEVTAGGHRDPGRLEQRRRVLARVGEARELVTQVGPVVEGTIGRRRCAPGRR